MQDKILVINIIGSEACEIQKVLNHFEKQGFHKIVLSTSRSSELDKKSNETYHYKSELDFIVKQSEYVQIDRSGEYIFATHNSEIKENNIGNLPANVARQYSKLPFIRLINICLACSRDATIEFMVKKHGTNGIAQALQQYEKCSSEMNEYLQMGEFVHEITGLSAKEIVKLVDDLVSIELEAEMVKVI